MIHTVLHLTLATLVRFSTLQGKILRRCYEVFEALQRRRKSGAKFFSCCIIFYGDTPEPELANPELPDSELL